MSEEELRRRYDAHSRGNAGVSGRGEDFSEMVAKEMANRKKQRLEKESKDKDKKGKEFKF
jgi:splicing factor 3B subunit 2